MPPSFGLRNLDLFETEYHINTRMHSSRMRTARSLLYQGISVWGGLYPGGLCPEAVADPGFSKWGGTVLSQMGGRTSCFQVKSA